MKKITVFTIATASLLLSGAEIIPLEKGNADITGGNTIVTVGSLRASLSFFWKTTSWISMKSAKSVMSKPEQNQWRFEAQSAPIEGTEKTSVTQTVKKISPDTLEYTWKWDAAPRQAVGHVFMCQVFTKDFTGYSVSINGQQIKTENESKYSISRTKKEDQKVTLTTANGRKLTLECKQKCQVILSTRKNSGIEIRFESAGIKTLTVSVTVK